MKTTAFKKKMAIIAIALSSTLSAFSADLVVAQGAPPGTYGSIGAAVAAAADGDVIRINNRIDGLPWQEDVIINKSVTLLSDVDNVVFWVKGTYEIVRASNRVITIVGMNNTSTNPNLFVSGSMPTVKTRLTLSQCNFSGNVYASGLSDGTSNGGIRTSIYASQCLGYTQLSFGEIYGSYLAKALDLNTNSAISNDTLFLVGNKIIGGMSTVNTTEVLMLKNNLIYRSAYTTARVDALNCLAYPKNGSKITNCAIYSYNTQGYSSSSTLNWNQIIENSIMNASLLSHNSFLCSYNLSSVTTLGGTGNILASAPSLSSTTLTYVETTNTINLGNPTNVNLDLDLSRNNIGVYGGSYNINNFHPINTTNSSVVNMVEVTPKVLYQGQTLNLKVIATDK